MRTKSFAIYTLTVAAIAVAARTSLGGGSTTRPATRSTSRPSLPRSTTVPMVAIQIAPATADHGPTMLFRPAHQQPGLVPSTTTQPFSWPPPINRDWFVVKVEPTDGKPVEVKVRMADQYQEEDLGATYHMAKDMTLTAPFEFTSYRAVEGLYLKVDAPAGHEVKSTMYRVTGVDEGGGKILEEQQQGTGASVVVLGKTPEKAARDAARAKLLEHSRIVHPTTTIWTR